MIGSWFSFVCCMHFYIKWQAWSLRLSCTIDGSRIEGHASLSSKHDGKHDHAHMCLKSHAIYCLFSVVVKSVFCRKLLPTGIIQCRPAIDGWPINPRTADGNSALPVGISPSRWYSAACKEPVLGLWKFSEKQGSINRGGSDVVRVFQASRVSSMHHSRIPRQRLRLRPPSSLFAFFLLIN